MKTRVFLFLAAAVLLASCAKEIQAPLEDQTVVSGPITLQVGINNPKDDLEVEPSQASTRTVLGEKVGDAYPVYWSNGDQIQINDKTSDALTEVAPFTSSTSFNFSEAPTPPYNVLYPASIYKDASHVTLPAVQTYKAGGFADKMFPMAGYSADGSNITINHLCAIVKVSVKRSADSGADTDNIAAVRFKGRASEKVSGNFEIDYSTPALAAATGTGAELEVRVVESLATSTSDAVVYYLVVPARAYASGFDIIVTDANNDIMTKTKSGAVTLAAGKMYSMAEFAFEPSGTDTGIEIASAEDLIAFATAFNNGDYIALGGLLRATVTADIAFNATSSDAFNLTGGIGTNDDGNGDTNYFNGVFDGNNHTISGLEATVPLFAYTGSHGDVKNLTLNDDCSFTFTHKNDAEGMFGAIVGYHKGTIDNVKVAADVSLADKTDVTNMTSLGGLVGYANGGVIQNGSEYSGLISTPDGFKSTKKLIIGGLAGRIKTSSSNIAGSYFKGAISNAAEITSTDKNNPYLIIGGVVGFVDGGASVSSSNSTADHAAVAGAHSSSAGQIVNKTKIAYNSVVGGIVGENNSGTVSQCNNSALVFNSIFKTGADISRYMKTGGIVGKNNAEGVIDGCNNTEKIQHRSNPKMQDIAGIAGYNAGTVKNCSNSGDVNHMTTGVSGAANKGGRIVNIAGVIGENAKGAVVSNVSNTANIQISAMEDGTNSEARMGGVIAYNLADIDGGESKSITNTGQVYFSPNFANQFLGYEFGGVVGYSEGSISNVKNSGYVYVYWNSDANVASKMCLGGIVGKIGGTSANVIGCVNEATSAVNSGEVYFNFKNGALHYDNYAGGILGYTNANVIVSGCSNSGNIHNANYTAKGKPSYVGGIVGYLAGASELRECSNSGEVYNNMSNNDDTATGSAFCGGIVGYVKGANGNLISLSKCSNTSDKTHGRRGYVGGIVGYGEYMLLSNCTFNQSIVNGTVTSACRWLGGIAGWAVNSQITGCTFSGSTLQATQLSANTNSAGGIAAKLDACVVDGCYSHVTTINNASADVDGGAIVGRSGNGNTIQNCHYKDTVNNVASKIAASGTFTDGGGNVADL